MYLWNINALVKDLRTNKVSSSQVRWYFILSPLLSAFNGLFFATLLFGHHLVEYSFHGWLKNPHPDLNFYNYWAWGLTALTAIIFILGFYLCYRVNQRGDGKDFWQRMACLSFPINFHITLYTLIALAIIGFIGYFFFQTQIAAFKHQVWPVQKTVKEIVDTVAEGAGVAIKTKTTSPGLLSAFLKTPLSILGAPFISIRVKAFLKSMRAMALMAYPIMSLLPPALSLLHYLLIRKMMKEVSGYRSN